MTTLRSVQLLNDLFAVQKRTCFLSKWEFCEATCTYGEPKWDRTWGTNPEYVMQYCVVKTEDEADMVLEKTAEAIRNKRISPIKVVRIIKKVNV